MRGGQGGGHFFPHVSAPLIFPPYLFGALSELLRFLLDKLFDLLGADLQPDHLGQRLLHDLVALVVAGVGGGGRKSGGGEEEALLLPSLLLLRSKKMSMARFTVIESTLSSLVLPKRKPFAAAAAHDAP